MKFVTQEQWELVDKLLLEKDLIVRISKSTGVSEPWLQKYIQKKYEK